MAAPSQPPTSPLPPLAPPDLPAVEPRQRALAFVYARARARALERAREQAEAPEPGREDPTTTNQDADQGNIKGCSPTSENSPAGGPRDDLDNLTS